ncbi:C1 family peptidase [Exilibacterium tricleocarpae]|nr:C1 family peptidase [Exilibacterium tricleocarpae]
MENRYVTPTGHLLNAVADTYDIRDLVYQPALIAVRDAWPAPTGIQILDQGGEGACTGFALAAVLNLLDVRRRRDIGAAPRGPVSARMLYEMARKFDEWPGDEYAGSSCRGAIRGWQNMGVCTDREWPYEENRPGDLTRSRAVSARFNKPGAYYRLRPRLADYHAAINEAGAIYVSARVHAGWYEPDAETGAIPYAVTAAGGHAFAIVGYNQEGFWVQNSWGKRWAKAGLALWRYDDWQTHVIDAWVVRFTVPTPRFHADAHSAVDDGRPVQFGRRKVRRSDIAGHFVHLDDGEFHPTGPYFSELTDVQETAQYLRGQDRYRHLLLYAHGGLNSTKASARRIVAMKDIYKKNGIYPFHFMYDTGLLEEIKDLVLRRSADPNRVTGFDDIWDGVVARSVRVPGRAIWREIKRGAAKGFTAGGAGTQVLQAIVDLLQGDWKIHLVGHSAGALLLAYLLERLGAGPASRRIATCSLMAPACTVADFHQYYRPLLGTGRATFGIDDMTVYNLSDRLERDDSVAGVYRKSLLYLVSTAFEASGNTALLGMEKYSTALHGSELEFIYSEGSGGAEPLTHSETHSGFDNDPATMNNILMRMLGCCHLPAVHFTREILDY